MLLPVLYDYQETPVRRERLAAGTDHCDSRGPVHVLQELVREGLVRDPLAKDALLSSTPTRRFIYAVGRDDSIRIGEDGTRGQPNAVKHETLFHNDVVAAAGEITFEAGRIARINDRSGSYGTTGLLGVDRSFANAVLRGLTAAGVEIDHEEWRRLSEKAG